MTKTGALTLEGSADLVTTVVGAHLDNPNKER